SSFRFSDSKAWKGHVPRRDEGLLVREKLLALLGILLLHRLPLVLVTRAHLVQLILLAIGEGRQIGLLLLVELLDRRRLPFLGQLLALLLQVGDLRLVALLERTDLLLEWVQLGVEFRLELLDALVERREIRRSAGRQRARLLCAGRLRVADLRSRRRRAR